MKNEYDLIYRFYDSLLHLPLRSVRRAIMDSLKDHKEERILDLCCGTGEQLKLLSRNGFSDLHGLDRSASMLRIARKKRYDRIKLYNEDASRTSLQSGSFDAIIISLALHEIERGTSKEILNEAHRLIKDDGIILIADYDHDDRTATLAKAGIFVMERSAGNGHYTNFKEFIRRSGLSSLIEKDRFELVDRQRKVLKSISISRYIKAKKP
jgi:ubiquinone/menaquinone biosynthesis C-methylase UbiE